MCDVWPCCPTDYINIRRWNIDGTIAWQTKTNMVPKAICGINSSRTVVVGWKTLYTESEIECRDSAGAIEWAVDVGALVELTLSAVQAADTYSTGYISKAMSVCMLSTYDIVVGVDFYWRQYNGAGQQTSLQFTRFVILDNATGAYVGSTARTLSGLLPHTMEIAQGLTYYSPDTFFARFFGQYGGAPTAGQRLGIYPVSGTTVLGDPFTDSSWADTSSTTTGYESTKYVDWVNTDADSVVCYRSSTTTYNGYNKSGAMAGAVSGSAIRSDLTVGRWQEANNTILYQPQSTIYGANQNAVNILTLYSTGLQLYGIAKINLTTLAIDGWCAVATDGYPVRGYQAWVTDYVAKYNYKYILHYSPINIYCLSLVSDAGAWQWRHHIRGLTAGHIGPDGAFCTIVGIPDASTLALESYFVSPAQPATRTS